MQQLLAMMMTWLAINFGLPASNDYPHVEFVTPAKMAEIRLARLGTAAGTRTPATYGADVSEIAPALYSFYDSRSRTIFLPKGWAAGEPADLSLLVHELVHHLQFIGKLEYPCPEARERPAYLAQARWLQQFGKTLAGEFAVDAMTVHLRTRCMG